MSRKENWRPVTTHPHYEVSDQGRVRNAASKILEPWKRTSIKSYATVSLYPNKRTVHIHVLVAEAFIGPRPLGAIVCHLNDNREDDRLVNIKWGTYSSNYADSVRNGRR